MDYSSHLSIIYTMATCHSLRVVHGEMIGDPLDVKMFQFTGWNYEEGLHDVTQLDDGAEFASQAMSTARSPPTSLSNNDSTSVLPFPPFAEPPLRF
jgi:cation-transporting ATPase 13A3/4/5